MEYFNSFNCAHIDMGSVCHFVYTCDLYNLYIG